MLEEWRNKLDNSLFVGAVLMDFSKVFEFIRHDLIITKIAAVYGMPNESLSLFLSYFTNRKLHIKRSTTYSAFIEIISGIPQGFILGSLFFNILTHL